MINHAQEPLSVLDEGQLDRIHDTAMRILFEVGTRVAHDEALQLLRQNGQHVDDDDIVRWDPAFVLEQVAKAPSAFTLKGRGAGTSVPLGGGSLAWIPVGGSPFVSDLERGRRDGMYDDHVNLIKLAQTAPELVIVQSGTTEAADLPETSRHLNLDYCCLRYSDRPFVAYGTSGDKARDSVELAAIVHGGHEQIAREPALVGIVNPNSPLVWDTLMVDALWAWSEAGQAVAVTPFLLAGATTPVSIAGGLAQLTAEALTGIALCQLVRPGAPCLFGSFYSAVDMRTGGPAFGTPEFVLAAIAGGQLARRYQLPYRGGGGLCSANAVDSQAATESAMSLWGTVLGGSDFVMHAVGWLEGGLTASFEKFVLDLEMVRMFDVTRRGIRVEEEELAFDAIRSEGPGGMFLANDHTVAHFRDWLFMSPLFRSQAYVTWQKQGAHSADQAATAEWKRRLATFEDPGLDDAIDEQMCEYIARRKRELD